MRSLFSLLCLAAVAVSSSPVSVSAHGDHGSAAPSTAMTVTPAAFNPNMGLAEQVLKPVQLHLLELCDQYIHSNPAGRTALKAKGWNQHRLAACLVVNQVAIDAGTAMEAVASSDKKSSAYLEISGQLGELESLADQTKAEIRQLAGTNKARVLISAASKPSAEVLAKVLVTATKAAAEAVGAVQQSSLVPVPLPVVPTMPVQPVMPMLPTFKPENFGLLLFPGFQALDVFGPLDFLNLLGSSTPVRLALISQSLAPVATKKMFFIPKPDPKDAAAVAAEAKKIPEISESVVPTHTLNDKLDLDVLIIPGGIGTRSLAPEYYDYIKRTYPTVKYLLTVCTGAAAVAKTGILDGKKATSNKASWKWVVTQGPKVNWVPEARWTKDGNIWTSSGISAGMDLTYEFIKTFWGEAKATNIANLMEYEPHKDAHFDPFYKIWNAPGALSATAAVGGAPMNHN